MISVQMTRWESLRLDMLPQLEANSYNDNEKSLFPNRNKVSIGIFYSSASA